MAAPSMPNTTPVENKRQLVEYLASGCKPRANWRIGTEHEKFAFCQESLRPLPYDGEGGIRAMLEGLQRFGWEAIEENGNVIALRRGQCAVTLEPGGQLELSGAPLENIHQTCQEVGQHLFEVKEVGAMIGVKLMGMGFNPLWPREAIPWMPKGRYAIMRNYMPKKGALGLDMMLRTCTVQVNLDFESESHMIRQFRAALALQPVATALFANSPFAEGRPNGYLSYRSHVWTDTDSDRCGVLPFVFDAGFGFERYVDYLLDVPMYFIVREGRYVDAAGQSFRDFLDGKLPARPGEKPTLGDWEDHLTTVFPEVRLKRYLEMRGADGGPWARLCALAALWTGLLYDDAALEEALSLVAAWPAALHESLRRAVPKTALATPLPKESGFENVRALSLKVLSIAEEGLKNRGRAEPSCCAAGRDESHFLAPLFEIARRGVTPAEDWLAAYEGRWQGRVEPVFMENAY